MVEAGRRGLEREDAIIFISYAAPDRDRVTPIALGLMARGLNVWMDHLRLRPGQNWEFEVQRALGRAAIVVVFASHNSVSRRGYIQREIKTALDKAKEKLLGDIYVIPVLLDDDLDYPEDLKDWHAVRSSDPGSESAIAEAITHQLAELSRSSDAAQAEAGFQWRRITGRESWEGLPGFDMEWSAYLLSSPDHPELDDVNAIVLGRIAQMKMWGRRTKLEQVPAAHSFGQARELRTTTLDIQFSEPVIQERVLSLLCAKHIYSAGAAHGNILFESRVFLLTPLVELSDLRDGFEEPEEALGIIRDEVRRLLLMPRRVEDELVDQLDEAWVERGTAEWSDFQVFRYLEAGLEITFEPYAVASYADGPQTVVIAWKLLAPLMNADFGAAAGVAHLALGDPPWLIEDQKV